MTNPLTEKEYLELAINECRYHLIIGFLLGFIFGGLCMRLIL